MKLLIIAGPYEADRIRRSAVAAGFETVAVEPGESLSGWITASRPQLIVMAPQMVNPDPALALAKVRSVPRGRVPIFLVGDEADEPRMASLSEGFFVRPVSPEALLEHAKVVLAAERARESTNLGHEFMRGGRAGSGARPVSQPTPPAAGAPGPAPPGLPGTGAARSAPQPGSSAGGARPASQPGPSASGGARPALGLKPLVATAGATAPTSGGPAGGADTSVLLAALDAGIDALLDAELSSALAATPKVAGPEAEFSNQTTADMKADDLPRQKAADGASPRNGAGGSGGAASGESRGVGRPEGKPAAEDGRARVLERFAVVEVGDYYQVLGVGRDATPAEVERAHARITGELEPEALGAELAVQLGAEIEAIRVVAGEALRILGDARLRARYSARL
jgi:hypothetical protein